MPIIQFTPGDFLAGKVMEKGPYRIEMTEIDQKASASQKSVNFWTTFTVTEGPYQGKELKCCFNTETSNSSVLGSTQFFPHRDLLKVKAAALGLPFDEQSLGMSMDTDELLNKPMDAMIDVFPNKETGELVNTIVVFLPLGKASAAPVF